MSLLASLRACGHAGPAGLVRMTTAALDACSTTCRSYSAQGSQDTDRRAASEGSVPGSSGQHDTAPAREAAHVIDQDFIDVALPLLGCPPVTAQTFSLHYPPLDTNEPVYPEGSLEANQMAALRRHNMTMPCKANQRIYGTVMAVDKDRVYVDAGTGKPHRFNRQELSVQDLVDGTVAASKRLSAHDVHIGDRFVFRIVSTNSPFGGVWLAPDVRDEASQKNAVWEEIYRASIMAQPINGRVLNRVSGGWAVGVGGFVGFLPFSMSSPNKAKKIGILQPFFLSSCNPELKTFVLMHPDASRRWSRQSSRGGSDNR